MSERRAVDWVDRGGRTSTLRDRIAARDLVLAMAAHSPLSARLVEEAGFDAIWASGFELATLYGVPDDSIITLRQHLAMTAAMVAAVRLPVIADIDTGFEDVDHTIREYQHIGVSAVVMEDKVFPKQSSLTPGARHELVSIEEFQAKIRTALAARVAPGFQIIARTEALIAGLGQAAALARGRAYEAAGADALFVHSKATTVAEMESFSRAWDGKIPLVIVPTTFPEMDAARARALGNVAVMIFGNHAMRASVAGMRRALTRIAKDGGTRNVEGEIASVADLLALQRRDPSRP
jgi:phosphoenolpyruvate phosphomutase